MKVLIRKPTMTANDFKNRVLGQMLALRVEGDSQRLDRSIAKLRKFVKEMK